MAVSRRTMLGRLLAAASLYPATKLALTIDARLERIAAREGFEDPARAKALRALRFLNSAQAVYWRAEHQFARAVPLLSSGPVRELGGSAVLTADGDELVVGFSFRESLSSDGRHYRFLLFNAQSGFAFETTESGIIRIGHMTATGFLGESIEAPATAPTPRTRVFQWAAAVAQLLVPTLQASRGPECCGACSGTCFNEGAYSCGTNCSSGCCNLGYSGCVWCCTQNGCGCASGC